MTLISLSLSSTPVSGRALVNFAGIFSMPTNGDGYSFRWGSFSGILVW